MVVVVHELLMDGDKRTSGFSLFDFYHVKEEHVIVAVAETEQVSLQTLAELNCPSLRTRLLSISTRRLQK